jgi:hypothetical protein
VKISRHDPLARGRVLAAHLLRHGDHVPGVPLDLVTPSHVIGHAVWTYVAAAVYAVGGVLLLVDR